MFEPPLDPGAIGGERVYMLVQFMDERRVRVGFRAREGDRWQFSEPADLEAVLGRPVERLIFIAWNAACAEPPDGERVGFPLYQQYRWDYVRYRYGLTKE